MTTIINLQIDFLQVSVELSEKEEIKKVILGSSKGGAAPHWLKEWARAYAQGEHKEVPLDVSGCSSFQVRVIQGLQAVPFGKTLSYKELANTLDSHPRAVARGCANNPFPLFVPCHRILQSDGGLGGFAFGVEMKKQLIAFEKKISLC